MIYRFICTPQSGSPAVSSLDFEWDDAAGTVGGRDADQLRQWASEQGIAVHPLPAFHPFSANPLKSREDMAAIIGLHHVLPAELADAYPHADSGEQESDVELIF